MRETTRSWLWVGSQKGESPRSQVVLLATIAPRSPHDICNPQRDHLEACRFGLTGGFRATSLRARKSVQGRFEPAGPRRTGRSRFAVVRWQHGGPLSNALLTLMAALASGLDVGLMVLTRLTPIGGDRLLALRSGRTGSFNFLSHVLSIPTLPVCLVGGAVLQAPGLRTHPVSQPMERTMSKTFFISLPNSAPRRPSTRPWASAGTRTSVVRTVAPRSGVRRSMSCWSGSGGRGELHQRGDFRLRQQPLTLHWVRRIGGGKGQRRQDRGSFSFLHLE